MLKTSTVYANKPMTKKKKKQPKYYYQSVTRNTSSKQAGQDTRLLFQQTMQNIQSQQTVKRQRQEMQLKQQMDLSMHSNQLAQVLHNATSASLNSSQNLRRSKKK